MHFVSAQSSAHADKILMLENLDPIAYFYLGSIVFVTAGAYFVMGAFVETIRSVHAKVVAEEKQKRKEAREKGKL